MQAEQIISHPHAICSPLEKKNSNEYLLIFFESHSVRFVWVPRIVGRSNQSRWWSRSPLAFGIWQFLLYSSAFYFDVNHQTGEWLQEQLRVGTATKRGQKHLAGRTHGWVSFIVLCGNYSLWPQDSNWKRGILDGNIFTRAKGKCQSPPVCYNFAFHKSLYEQRFFSSVHFLCHISVVKSDSRLYLSAFCRRLFFPVSWIFFFVFADPHICHFKYLDSSHSNCNSILATNSLESSHTR